ncbi:hypothetical protein TSOC_012654 [Tetrabaena socialis]|uniref:Uncharacterized protein n=1 Tax=Tetrabaena socialis TaxID=47790 RepID=A0A2J7ZMH0_9CHLO|nr:hypothetical protein TSOC_012654 [Tetrabaena socialis]|eukprot:PNH01457.1 hypothetical protein TSOC_012654 [Tetrabaena socialis]
MTGSDFASWAYTRTGDECVTCWICEHHGGAHPKIRRRAWDRSAFTAHERSQDHNTAVQKRQEVMQHQRANKDLGLTEMNDEALYALFATSYMVLYFAMPFTHYTNICQLHQHLKLANTTTLYNDPRALGRFTACIVDKYEAAQAERMQKATFIGIQMEEATSGSDSDYEPDDSGNGSDHEFESDYDERTPGAEKNAFVQQFKFSDVENTVSAVKSCLRDAFIDVVPGQYTTPALRAFFSEMEATNYASFKGHALEGVPSSPARVSSVHALFEEYAKNLVANLGQRFPDIPFLAALAVFDPAEYPESLQEVRWWASRHLAIVHKYFAERRAAPGEPGCGSHPTLDVEEAVDQFFNRGAMRKMWELRADAIRNRDKFVKFYVEQKAMLACLLEDGMSLVDDAVEGMDAMQSLNGPSRDRPPHHINIVMVEMTKWGKGLVPMFLKVMLFCVLIKPTSVNCERIFSLRTVLKTHKRTRLSPIRLSQCSFLKFNTSGDLAVEQKMLLASMKEWKKGRKLQLYTEMSNRVENKMVSRIER